MISLGINYSQMHDSSACIVRDGELLFAVAEERLSRTELQRATVEARIYSPAEAKDAGFLDVVVPPDQVLEVALEEAKRLAALDPGAYSGTLAKLRGPCLDRLNAAVASGR